MKTMRMWQITVMAGMVLVLAGSGQVQGDFRFGEPANLATVGISYETNPFLRDDHIRTQMFTPREGDYV
ncbi:MAG: hypothetical protein ACETWQ_15640 [Phycisphaerae bacterium]